MQNVPDALPAEPGHLLEAVGLWKSFGDRTVVRDVSFSVSAGESLCILGPSGSGKSTLLRCLNRLETADRGVVLLDGELFGEENVGNVLKPLNDRALSAQRVRVGMVFQSFNLFPHMSVLENLTLAPKIAYDWSNEVAVEKAHALLERVGLADFANSQPADLSGGQQQRVAIAHALCMEPDLILFDEPTSALDPELVGEVLDVIAELVAGGMTSIIVTHEVGFARKVCDRFIFMEDGSIVEQGESSLLTSTGAKEARTREFLSRVL